MTNSHEILLGQSEADRLRWRIFNVIPAAQYCMNTLLELFELVVTDAVPTAAVRCGEVPVLLINPQFVNEWCTADEDLFALIMHELHHVLLGHTRLFPCPTKAHNLVFDAVINAYLCHLLEPEYTQFFSRFYSETVFPVFLLRPPVGWPDSPDWMLPARHGVAPEFCRLHKRLYSPDGVTYDEIFQALIQALASEEWESVTILLGDHAPGSGIDPYDAQAQDNKALLQAALRRLIEHWPPSHVNPNGRSLAGAIQHEFVPRVKPPSNRQIVQAAFRHAAFGSGGNVETGVGTEFRPVTGPIPSLSDRRAHVGRALGHQPLLYTREMEIETTTALTGGRVHLYVDVSGSLSAWLPSIYESLRPFASSLYPTVHLFSTTITDVSLREFLKGTRITDLGTEISPVIDHLIAHRVRKALVVTDGFTGPVHASDAALLRKHGTSITVLLTPNGSRMDLDPVTCKFYEFSGLKETHS